MSSALGGYLAARLRSKWNGVHLNKSFFRDTAHGLTAWAFATIVSAALLGGAATHLVAGAASGVAPAAAQGTSAINPSQVYVDRLFRTDGAAAPAQTGSTQTAPAQNTGNGDAARAEILRLWVSDFQRGNDIAAADRTYMSRLVSAQTGLSQADAEKRVNDVVTEAKSAADDARKAAAKFAFWMTAALLFGAFAASLAAVEGGQHRDGTWTDYRLVPRAW